MAITQSEERRTRHFLTTLERLVQEVQDTDLRTWPMAAVLEERWRYRRVLKVSKDFELPDDDSYRRVNDDEILLDLTHHGKLEQSFASSSLPTSRSLKIRFSIPEDFGSGDMDNEIDALLNKIKTELVNDLEGIVNLPGTEVPGLTRLPSSSYA